MARIKLKIITFLLQFNIWLGKKLSGLHGKYTAEDQIMNSMKDGKFDIRKISSLGVNIKNLILRDKDIIDKRWAECEQCEHLIKATSQCSLCKCFMKVKTRISTARCPMNPPKWDKEYDFQTDQKLNGVKNI